MTAPPKGPAQAIADRLLKALAVNVRHAREELGMTQRELAAAVETSQRRIVMIENAIANPTILTLARLSKCLNRTVVELLTPPPRNLTP